MQFVAQHTSLPVTKVYCSFGLSGRTYTVMERIKRQTVSPVWGTLSKTYRGRILLQLKAMVAEMWAIPARNNCIASSDGGSLWGCRLPSNLQRLGPFKHTQDFHRFLRNNVEESPRYPEIDEIIALRTRIGGSLSSHMAI